MHRQKRVRRALYALLAADVVMIAALVFLTRFVNSMVLAAVTLPVILIGGWVFLSLRMRRTGLPTERAAGTRGAD